MGQNKWYKLGLLNQGSGEKKDVSGSHLLLGGVGQTAHIFGYTVVFHPEIICKQCKELKGSSLQK
jgi:hypothetical protein